MKYMKEMIYLRREKRKDALTIIDRKLIDTDSRSFERNIGKQN